jgi:hypothetical protein
VGARIFGGGRGLGIVHVQCLIQRSEGSISSGGDDDNGNFYSGTLAFRQPTGNKADEGLRNGLGAVL